MLLTPQTGSGKNGPWKKQDFVIETTDTYPKKVCLAAWGDKIDLNKIKPGQTVKVLFDVESREYNGKWYTDLKAYGLQPAQGFARPLELLGMGVSLLLDQRQLAHPRVGLA